MPVPKHWRKICSSYLAGQPTRARPANFPLRAWLWCRRVERVREAGVVLACFSLAQVIWNALGALFIAMGLLQPERLSTAFIDIGISVFFFGLAFWLGVKTIQHRLWAIWSGTVITIVILTLATSFFAARTMDLNDMGGLYNERDPGLSMAFALFTLVMDGVPVLAMVMGLLAYYANRQTLAWSQPVNDHPGNRSWRKGSVPK